jgi:sugar lactone lactonase YvrE
MPTMTEAVAPGVEVLVGDAIYTESPRWHEGALWFSDMGAGAVKRVTLDGGCETMLKDIETPSGLGWTRSGELIVVSIHDAAIYRIGKDGTRHVMAGPEQHGTRATNDMATADGRSYVTCSGRDYEKGDDYAALSAPVGKILLLDHDSGAVTVVAEGLVAPNGVGISSDGKTLIVAEVFNHRLLRFDIRRDGTLSAPKVAVDLGHMVDGLCLDADNGAWVGTTDGRFKRVDLATGQETQSVDAPGWKCIAPMLGGPDGRTLFLAVNRFNDADDIFSGRARGGIFKARATIPAAAEAVFS